MQFTNTKFNGAVVELTLLTEIMENNHFVLAGQWDYERVTYDYKFEILKDVYYLRVQGVAVEGDIGSRHAEVKLLPPYLGNIIILTALNMVMMRLSQRMYFKKANNSYKNVEKELKEFQIID